MFSKHILNYKSLSLAHTKLALFKHQHSMVIELQNTNWTSWHIYTRTVFSKCIHSSISLSLTHTVHVHTTTTHTHIYTKTHIQTTIRWLSYKIQDERASTDKHTPALNCKVIWVTRYKLKDAIWHTQGHTYTQL